jgi:aldose 1-epimerase
MPAETLPFHVDAARAILCAPGGREVRLDPVGAAVAALYWPDTRGRIQNLVMPTGSPTDYAGATLGPAAGRLAGAVLPVEGKRIPLCANEGPNTLHGGAHNLSHRMWRQTACGSCREDAWMKFDCTLADGVDGFPGNRRFTACYTLTRRGLRVEYTATTDRITFVNMSNHTYWNLTGDFSADGYAQTLQIPADTVWYNDTAHLPVREAACRDTAFDFLCPVTLHTAMRRDGRTDAARAAAAQLKNARGYNNAFVLRPDAPFAARLADLGSGRALTVITNQSSLVVYSGGFLPVPGCAVALEAQARPGSTVPLLNPGEIYRSCIFFWLEP